MRTRSQRNQASAAIIHDSNTTPKKLTFDDNNQDDNHTLILAEPPAPALNHSNDQDNDDNDDNDDDDNDDDDDDAPVELVSSKASRKQAASQATKIKAEHKAAQQKRRKAEKERLEKRAQLKQMNRNLKPEHPNLEAPTPIPVTYHSDSEDKPAPSLLDPSLFAAAFATKSTVPKSILKKSTIDHPRTKKLKPFSKGRDGMPMRRLSDGTIVRSLSLSSSSKTSIPSESTLSHHPLPLDPLLRPTLLDPTISLPSAKVRSFKKRKLSLAPSTLSKPKPTPPSVLASDQDDPLGLKDPEFMPGGKFYPRKHKQKLTGSLGRNHSNHSHAASPRSLARQGFRGSGGRIDLLSTLSNRTTGPSLAFAKSLS